MKIMISAKNELRMQDAFKLSAASVKHNILYIHSGLDSLAASVVYKPYFA